MGLIADVAALARAGYTMADIRELMTTKEPEEPKDEPKEPKEPKEHKELPKDELKEQLKEESEINYKVKYEELLAKMQGDNRKQNFGGGPDTRTDEEKAVDILAALF